MFIAQVAGFVSYGNKFPNGNAYPQYPALGHLDDAGVTGENEFGKDYVPVWAGKYCNTDSDGDGYTNGQGTNVMYICSFSYILRRTR